MENYTNIPKPRTKIEKSIYRRKRLKREYDEWIYDGHLYDQKRESSITLGVVPGVVVEERRLKHLLYELARQRHVFNSKHSYDKKVFFDKQMKKSTSLRRALQHESLSRGWSVNERDISLDDSSEGISVEHGFVPRNSEKATLSKTRVGLMSKDEEKNGTGEFQWITLPPIDSKPNSGGTYLKTVTFDAPVIASPRHSAHLDSRAPTLERFPGLHRERSKSLPTSCLIPWSEIKSTNIQPGKCLPPIVKDSRFVDLEARLLPTYSGSTRLKTVGITSIINKCDALNIPVKEDKKSKKDMAKQIRQFLTKMGIIST